MQDTRLRKRRYREILGDFVSSERLYRVLIVENAERVSYMILVIGSLFDHVSSRLALMNPNVYEANKFAQWLQANGHWIIFDVSIVVLLILPFSLIIQFTSLKGRRIILLTPLMVGLARLIVGVWNLMQLV